MIIQTTVNGVFSTNSYFYVEDETRHCLLIDPGFEAEKILDAVRERELTVEGILITHGHFDHFTAAEDVQQRLGVPIVMGERSKVYVENPKLNLSAYYEPMTLHDVNYVPDDTSVSLATNPDFALRLVSVPGHTPDSMMFLDASQGVAFVGDTIFKNSFGLTHFPGGDMEMLFKSCVQKVLTLPEETYLLSGHSEPTTVGEERTRSWFNNF